MQIVPSVSVANVLNQRDGLVSRLTSLIANLVEANESARAFGLRFPCFSVVVADLVYLNSKHHMLTGSVPIDNHEALVITLTKFIDASAWERLMLESGLFSVLDAQARNKWRDQIAQFDVIPFCVESIQSTFGALYASRGEMFERGVIDCYRALSWHYKTNSPVKFGKRIIVNLGPLSQHPNRHGCDTLDDLTRVFCALDNRPEPDHRTAIFELAMAAYTKQLAVFENDYLSVRRYQNGNAHVTFKRADLIDELNKILATHYPNALPSQ